MPESPQSRNVSGLAAALLATALPVAADDLSANDDSLSPFTVRAGVFDMNSSTVVRLDSSSGRIGTRFSFEEKLNLDDRKDTWVAGARWRFKDRHFIELEYFKLGRTGFRRLESEINFGDMTFTAGADVRSSFTTEVTRLTYNYRVLRSPDWGMAFGAGIHVTRLHASLTEVITDSGGTLVGDREIAKVTAPLPVLGFSGARRLSDDWALLAQAQSFFLDLNDVDGAINHAALHFEHGLSDSFGFGFGYDWFDIDVGTKKEFWRGSTDVSFHGPMAFLKGSF